MRHSIVMGAALLLFAALGSGCSHQISGGPEAGVDMNRYHSFYVVSEKNDADVAKALRTDLSARGLSVSSGPDSATLPAAADCKVIYHDKWMWDVTMYLLEVKLEMVDPRSGAMLASGRCYRTSMARKAPEVMVKEITDRIFGTTASDTTAKVADAR